MSGKHLTVCALLLCTVPVCADQLVFDSALENGRLGKSPSA